MKLVSVVIPYYNNRKTIVRALESIKNQTYSNMEIITINDGSNDDSFDIVEEWRKSTNLNLINITQKNQGPSVARNIGIEKASGEYIAFLDADDSWINNKIEKQINYLETDESIAIIGCDHYISINGELKTKSKSSRDIEKVTFDKKLIKNYFCTPSVVIRSNVLNEEKFRFCEEQKYAEDTLLYLQILRKYNCVKMVEPLVVLYKLEISNEGLSSNLLETEKYELINFWKLYKENHLININKIPIYKLLFLWGFSMIKFIRRIIKIYI